MILYNQIRNITLWCRSAEYYFTGKLDSALMKNRIQFIYMHHVFENELNHFRILLNELSKSHKFISYTQAIDKITSGNIDDRYLTISFDDGIKNCLDAASILNEFNIKTCFFINTSLPSEQNEKIITQFCRERLHSPKLDFLNWDDIVYLKKNGHEIGGHTKTHLRLSEISDQQIRDEIGGCFDELTKRIGKVKHFSWPYGLFKDFNKKAAKCVFESGFTSCASAVRGCHYTNKKINKEEVCIRRDHILSSWPIIHIKYFLANNALNISSENNYWPSNFL